MASARATFVELQQLYNFDEKIVDKIVASGVTSLSEFRFFCKDEEDVVTTFIRPWGSRMNAWRALASKGHGPQ